MSALTIIFAGTPPFAATHLNALLEKNYSICAVYTQPDRPAGRGRHPQPSAVKQLAQAHKLPTYQPSTLTSPETQQELRALKADVMVVVAYGLLLPPAALGIPHHGCINVHASLLPRWRGAAPIQYAILNGDNMSGVTTMSMEAGLDTGPMLQQANYALSPTETSQSLHDKLAQLGPEVLIETLEALRHDKLTPVSQDHAQSTYAPKIKKQQAKIDWSLSAHELDRQIRAFNPWPVAYTQVQGERLRLWAATPLDIPHGKSPGTIVDAKQDKLCIACGDGLLALEKLQLPGKKTMHTRDILNAKQSLFTPGTVLGETS